MEEALPHGLTRPIGDEPIASLRQVLHLMEWAAAKARELGSDGPARKPRKPKATQPEDTSEVYVTVMLSEGPWNLHRSLLDEMANAFPLANAEQVVREGVVYLKTAGGKRYTRKGMPAFWRNQFTRAQRQAEARNSRPQPPANNRPPATNGYGQENKRFNVPNHQQTADMRRNWERPPEKNAAPKKPSLVGASLLDSLLTKGNGEK